MNNQNDKIFNLVLERVNACLDSLISSSGHLATYYIQGDSFKIDKVQRIEPDKIQYFFSAQAQYESEFTVYEEDTEPEIHAIAGSIILTNDFEYVYNEKGEIMLEPYKSLLRKEAMVNEIPKKKTSSPEKSSKEILSKSEIDDLLSGLNS